MNGCCDLLKSLGCLMILNDADIRPILKLYLERQCPRWYVLDEIEVADGCRRADVVTVCDQDDHCYEIKGDNDSINRAVQQAQAFDYAFTRCTLVTTEKHVSNAERLMPAYWGIAVCDGVGIQLHRAAEATPEFNTYTALSGLWRDELWRIAELKGCHLRKSYGRHKLYLQINSQVEPGEIRRLYRVGIRRKGYLRAMIFKLKQSFPPGKYQPMVDNWTIGADEWQTFLRRWVVY